MKRCGFDDIIKVATVRSGEMIVNRTGRLASAKKVDCPTCGAKKFIHSECNYCRQ